MIGNIIYDYDTVTTKGHMRVITKRQGTILFVTSYFVSFRFHWLLLGRSTQTDGPVAKASGPVS